MVMSPEDRRKQGLVMTMRVSPNMTLPHLGRFAHLGVMKRRAERTRALNLIEHFNVRPADPNGNVATFSGGNQQKVLIGKWLMENPDIVILDEPSRGVDVGARERIHFAIAELAAAGTGVLLISSEIEGGAGPRPPRLPHRRRAYRRRSDPRGVERSRPPRAALPAPEPEARRRMTIRGFHIGRFLQTYAVLIMIVFLVIALSMMSENFLTAPQPAQHP